MDPVARLLLVSLLVGALLKVKSLFLTLWQIYFYSVDFPSGGCSLLGEVVVCDPVADLFFAVLSPF